MAVALVERWSEWPGAKMVICGPRGSGKTHLAHVWAKLSGARIVGADTLAEAEIPDLASGPVCVEDVPQIAGDRPAEEALFHLHNLVLAQGHSLLMTAEREPTLWPLVLPDLKSRIMGAQVARMGAPDDALLTALLAKQFADCRISPGTCRAATPLPGRWWRRWTRRRWRTRSGSHGLWLSRCWRAWPPRTTTAPPEPASREDGCLQRLAATAARGQDCGQQAPGISAPLSSIRCRTRGISPS